MDGIKVSLNRFEFDRWFVLELLNWGPEFHKIWKRLAGEDLRTYRRSDFLTRYFYKLYLHVYTSRCIYISPSFPNIEDNSSSIPVLALCVVSAGCKSNGNLFLVCNIWLCVWKCFWKHVWFLGSTSGFVRFLVKSLGKNNILAIKEKKNLQCGTEH